MPAAVTGTVWDSVPSSCREGRILFRMIRGWKIRWRPSGRGIPGARSPFRWAKSPGNPMRDSAGQGQTGICSAMRRRPPAITGSCIPPEMSLENRMRCLRDLKELGYQTGTGMMIGSPGQTLETLWEDLEFIRRLRPEMIGIGPYLVHHGTPFADQKNGSLTWTLRLLSVLRLLYPDVLLPATTALSTLHPEGRKLGILAGANVVMPNLGMPGQREKYELYDHKLCAGQEAAEGRKELENMMGQIGYTLSESRGDFQEHSPRCRKEE